MVWVRADVPDSRDERKKIVLAALESNFMDIVLREEDRDAFERLGKFHTIVTKDQGFFMDGKKVEYITIQGKEDQTRAQELSGNMDYVVVAAPNWKVIPFENLIAAYQDSMTKVLAEVENIRDARLFFETLEVGVDGIVFATADVKRIYELRDYMDNRSEIKMKLVSGKITKIELLASGDRVCIDTCSMLKLGEGMLVGSQSSGLFLVHSESVESEYVSARPFRVNAGSVHSYVLSLKDKTRYLSELSAGQEILAVDGKGNARSVVLGRVKIEKRPLVLLEAEHEGKRYNIILQNAETIRLVSRGKPVSIVDLSEGDEVLMFVDSGGRHFGMKVKESISEK